MTIVLVYTTYNRLTYTKLTLPRLLADKSEQFQLIVWDNGSTDGTPEFLDNISDDRIIERVYLSHNAGRGVALNHAWFERKADLVGSVDNDCLVTPGWTRVIAKAHSDLPELGAVGCWHFMPEDFVAKIAQHKIKCIGTHQVVVHPWIDGSAYLVKRDDAIRLGPVELGGGLTRYWIRLARWGRTNGWYYPLIYQEHLDDPRSKYCILGEDLSVGQKPFTASSQGFRTKAEWQHWIEQDAREILESPSDVKHYVGMRGVIRRRARRAWRQLFERERLEH
jgi:glycosyltransferase involved in cell wall biosynthesis